MLVFAKTKPLAATTTSHHLVNPRISALLILSTVLLACSGCGDSKAPVATTPQVEFDRTDPLADVLRFAKAGDIDVAIEQFVASAPDNWLESTALEEFRVSEADFVALDRAEKTRLQQQFIDRVGEIKGFVRTVIDRAKEARNRGDEETAQQYLDAVHRFGQQLRDSDTAIIFQQTGHALANWPLSE